MVHDQMLPECQIQFGQIGKGQAILERKLDKVIEKVGEVATSMAVTTVTVQNHQTELEKAIDRQEERNQIAIGRLWKVILVILASLGIGGGGAAINNLVF